MLRIRPRNASGAFSCTSEFSVENAVTRAQPATNKSAIENGCRDESTAAGGARTEHVAGDDRKVGDQREGQEAAGRSQASEQGQQRARAHLAEAGLEAAGQGFLGAA